MQDNKKDEQLRIAAILRGENNNPDTRLLVSKIIYGSKKFKKTIADIENVLKLCVETHLGKHSDLVFLKTNNPIKNPDKTLTFQLVFDYKIKYQKNNLPANE